MALRGAPSRLLEPDSPYWDTVGAYAERLGLGDPLGCGGWGCVFEAGPQVAKITLDPTEGPIAWLVYETPELRNMPGVAWIDGVWRLGERLEGFEYFLILREPIEPLSVHEAFQASTAAKALDGVVQAAKKLNRGEDRGDFDRAIGRASMMTKTRDVADFMDAFEEHIGGALADVHAMNVGTRGGAGPWVAFDLGHSDLAVGLEVPLMANPGLVPLLP